MKRRNLLLASLKKGFTLLELLVVVGITALLSAILISYSSSSRQQIALYAEEARLGQTIYRAKFIALSSYVRSTGSPGTCGYGVHIDYAAMSYYLFSYNKPANSGCDSINSIDTNSENIMSTFRLNKNIKLVAPSGTPRLDDILYVPPDPKIIISSAGTVVSNGSAAVIIQTQDNLLSAPVSVNSAGLISF